MADLPTQGDALDPVLLQQLGDLELVAREVVEGLRVGSHRSPLRGFSTEFAHHRPYSPGDALRHLDWRVYARSDRYYTKLYEAETNYDCTLLIDASASMRYASGQVSKLEYAKFLAASLAYIVIQQRDSVGLTVFDSEVRTELPPRSTKSVLVEIERALQAVRSLPRTSVASQLHEVALRLKRRSFVILLSDLFSDVEDVLAGLDRLRYDGHNVVVFQTLDPYELEFPFEGVWRFEGLEGEEPLTTQPERVRESYLARLGEFLRALQAGCVASQVDYALVNTARPLDAVLREFVHQREATLRAHSSPRA